MYMMKILDTIKFTKIPYKCHDYDVACDTAY